MPEDLSKQSLNQDVPSEPSGMKDEEIFVMPELGAPKMVKPHGKKLPLPALLGLFGVLVLVGLGVFAFLTLQPPKSEKIARPSTSSVEQETKVLAPPIAPAPSIATQATTTPEISPPAPPDAPAEVLAFGPDDDADGLTNQEERLIYKSDSLRPDTDGDGFLDGNEVFHLYSPISVEGGKLEDSGLAVSYNNVDIKYSLLYPTDWQISATTTIRAREVLISASTGEMVTITAIDNLENFSVFDWYSREVGEDDLRELEPITTKGNLGALQTKNRLTTYLAASGKILVISLNIGDKTQVEYRRTYEMILNSLRIK